MKYENAKEILPEELFREVQKYAAGKLLYIPSDSVRKAWGTQSGARADFHSRNHEIRTRFAMGISPETLAGDYYLAPETIKKIVYRKEKSMDSTTFPDKKFDYQITETGGAIPEIVCEEHPGYGVIPRVGEKARFAVYRQPEGKVLRIGHAEAVAEWEIHGVHGVRIDVTEEYMNVPEPIKFFVVAELTEEGIRNLAWGQEWGKTMRLNTFLEGKDFTERMWNISPTHFSQGGTIRKQGDSVTVSDTSVLSDAVGRYRVSMNSKEYDTVLVVNVEDLEEIVTESYLGLDGRSVLSRQFIREGLCEELRESTECMLVNGTPYYHIADFICYSIC